VSEEIHLGQLRSGTVIIFARSTDAEYLDPAITCLQSSPQNSKELLMLNAVCFSLYSWGSHHLTRAFKRPLSCI